MKGYAMAEKIYCYILPERKEKTERIVGSFAQGCGGQLVYDMDFRPEPGSIVVVWGQVYASADIMRDCASNGIDFYQIDNGYFHGARGKQQGYYRVTKNALVQNRILKRKADRFLSLNIQIKPYRAQGNGICIAIPGENYGRYKNLDLQAWQIKTENMLKILSERKIYVRPKVKEPSLADYLHSNRIHCLVTHSSNAAIDALIEGFPVFCEPECAAAPVGNLNLDLIEQPLMPDRTEWAYSLAYCQFTSEEFASGLAWRILKENDEL